MVLIAVFALVAGVLCGRYVFTEEIARWLSSASDYVLYGLMFFVGISVGMNKSFLKKYGNIMLRSFLFP